MVINSVNAGRGGSLRLICMPVPEVADLRARQRQFRETAQVRSQDGYTTNLYLLGSATLQICICLVLTFRMPRSPNTHCVMADAKASLPDGPFLQVNGMLTPSRCSSLT